MKKTSELIEAALVKTAAQKNLIDREVENGDDLFQTYDNLERTLKNALTDAEKAEQLEKKYNL